MLKNKLEKLRLQSNNIQYSIATKGLLAISPRAIPPTRLIYIKDIIEYALSSYIVLLISNHIAETYHLNKDTFINTSLIFLSFGAMLFLFSLFTILFSWIKRMINTPETTHLKVSRPIKLFRPLISIYIIFLLTIDWITNYIKNNAQQIDKDFSIYFTITLLLLAFYLITIYYFIHHIKESIDRKTHKFFIRRYYNLIHERSFFNSFSTDIKILKDTSQAIALLFLISAPSSKPDVISQIIDPNNNLKDYLLINARIALIPIVISMAAWTYWRPETSERIKEAHNSFHSGIPYYIILTLIFLPLSLFIKVTVLTISQSPTTPMAIHILAEIAFPLALSIEITDIFFKKINEYRSKIRSAISRMVI